ncbi:exocyst subunit exo70 family protein E1 [Actinidia rufa]|uniref:Exocyst subunit Exo70 family protein n=1 Tax=Actinidia rufa TaxID=165716 RepID=A0A7J0EL86_9ERIC|nr:exocyst subunit exo70 family protein E1 [Actinidia rufa]
MLEREEDLIAAAQHIVRAVEMRKNLSNDTRKILSDLGNQLFSIAKVSEGKCVEEGIGKIEERLRIVQDKVMNWEVDESMIWDCGSEEADEYVKAVDEARRLTQSLESLCLSRDSDESELLRRAHDVLQTAMVRLEEEFRHMLVHNRQPFEPEHVSFRSNEDDVVDEGSIVSFGDDSVDEVLRRESLSRSSEEFIMDWVHPSIIPELKCIANLMFDSNYDQECTHAFISVQKDALDDCLFILEVEKLSIEDVLKLEWNTLNSKMQRWIRAMKIFVRVYLASEKRLSDQIFGDRESFSSTCFVEASRVSVLQLLNFAEAVAIGPCQPEKLLRILDMYEVLADLSPDIDALYADEIGSRVRTECQDVLRRLGNCVKATYVMNYIRNLTDYNETLDLLLKDDDKKYEISFSPDLNPVSEDDSVSGRSSRCISPTALHFRSLTSILECNLEGKSKLYKEDSLRHLFLMNNIHYMAEKVKVSELRMILGDGWIRKHNWKFQQHAMNYERATWSSILSLLKGRGDSQPRQLREDLRISTSLKVIQAYRTFVGRHTNHLKDKNIKYNADDLESFLLDLFEGSPRSLHYSHRK